jgi:outer membrane protein
MRTMKKLSVLVSAVLLTTGIGVCQAADTAIKVAVVNVQQVLQQSPRVVALSKKLEGEFKGRQTKINDEQKALQDRVDQFKKESPTMTQKDRDNTQKKISAERSDLVKQVVTYQQDLQKKQGEIMQEIQKDLNNIVSNIAKNQSYGLVLDSQAVIFAADGNDITKDVAKQFNGKA